MIQSISKKGIRLLKQHQHFSFLNVDKANLSHFAQCPLGFTKKKSEVICSGIEVEIPLLLGKINFSLNPLRSLDLLISHNDFRKKSREKSDVSKYSMKRGLHWDISSNRTAGSIAQSYN